MYKRQELERQLAPYVSRLIKNGQSTYAYNKMLELIDSCLLYTSIGQPGEAVADAPVAAPEAKEAEAGSVLVIGGGPGGYVAAIRAAQLGACLLYTSRNSRGYG